MSKRVLKLLAIGLMGIGVTSSIYGNKVTDNQYLNQKNPRLSRKEMKGIELAREWIRKKEFPSQDENGKIVYLYGATMPSIVTSPLTLTDIELQAGEVIKNMDIGDSVHWKVMASMSGPNGFEKPHIIIKPTDVGLRTSMVITTDRRTYHIGLVSRQNDFIPYVGFVYPDDLRKEMEAMFAKQERRREQHIIPETRENISQLDFNYSIMGFARWKPVRVYNNGIKTIIQMPDRMKQAEAPALLVLGPKNEEQLVNYRLKGNRFIVDQIFDKAILISGVGSNQQKITISREKS
ncbi:MAG: P-type conjugative transfer protein TrbG [Candidatus Margulisbacteria bacterium]|nr:P-type conjugative transfer protein TrbG [Candidatus Margulisiibacteriota bacterium]